MNLRTFQYFLTVCETGTFHAAARKLYITPQSISERINRLEKDIGVPLFYRENPLRLTEAGRYMKKAAEQIDAALRELDRNLIACKSIAQRRLTIGLADHGTPPFLTLIMQDFIAAEPDILVETKPVSSDGPIPEDVSLIISALKMNDRYTCELLLKDHLVICVSDELLKRLYDADWETRRSRLSAGDLTALEGCPFVRQTDSLAGRWTDIAFRNNQFIPQYLPVHGSDDGLISLCISANAAMTMFHGRAAHIPQMPPAYPIRNIPERIPSCYICYPADKPLSAAAQRFLEISRSVLQKIPEWAS